MLKTTIFNLILLCVSLCTSAQSVQIINDLRPGSSPGYLQSYTLFNEELYFTGSNEGPAFQEVFSVGSDLTITKKLSANTIRGASIIESTSDFLYVYNREAPQDRELYRSTGSNSSLTLITEFTNDISQSASLSEGVVFVEEDEARVKKVNYISDDSNESAVIIDNVDLVNSDFEITETQSHIIISPFNDGGFDGGVIAYDKSTKSIDDNFLSDICPSLRYAYGFENQIVYSCDGSYYVYDIMAAQSNQLNIDGRNSLRGHLLNRSFSSSQDYIVLSPDEEDVLISIERSTLSIITLTDEAGAFVNLLDEHDKLYYIDRSNNETKLIESNADGTESREIIGDEIKSLRAGAVLNGKVHLVAYLDTDFYNTVLKDDGSLESLVKINDTGGFVSFLKVLGNHIVFPNYDSATGLELYSISYGGVSVDDENLEKLSLYPNPSNDGYVYFGERVKNYKVFDMVGKLIQRGLNSNHVQIDQIGNYVITGTLENGAVFMERVIIK